MGSKLLPWIIVGGLVLFAGGTCYRMQDVARARDFAVANYQAALDTTRRYLVGENESLSRLVQQAEIESADIAEILGVAEDSISALMAALEDREVDRVVAVQSLRFALDSVTRENAALNADIVALSRSGEGFRVVAIDVEGPPISGDVDVSVPLDTARAWEVEFMSLAVDPFEAIYTLSCEGDNAVVAAQAPDWVNMDLNPGRVDPDVCIPPRVGLGSIFSFSPGNVTWGVLGAVVGFLIAR